MTILKGDWRCELLCERYWFLAGAVHLHTLSVSTSVGSIRSWIQWPPFGICPHSGPSMSMASSLRCGCPASAADAAGSGRVRLPSRTSAAPQAKCTKSKFCASGWHKAPGTSLSWHCGWQAGEMRWKENPFQCQNASQPNRVWHSVLPKALSQQEKNPSFSLGLFTLLASSPGSSVNGKSFPLVTTAPATSRWRSWWSSQCPENMRQWWPRRPQNRSEETQMKKVQGNTSLAKT